jgi:hypothetical protein
LLLLVRHGVTNGQFRRIGTTCCHNDGPYLSETSIKITSGKADDQLCPPNKTENKSEKNLSTASDSATSIETDRLRVALNPFATSNFDSRHIDIDTSVRGSDDFIKLEETDSKDEEDTGHTPFFPFFLSNKDNLFNSLENSTIDSGGIVYHHNDLFSEIVYDTDGTKHFIIDLV